MGPEDVLFHHASIPKNLSRINEDINSEPLDYQAVSDQLFEQSTQNRSSEFKQKSLQDKTMTNNTYSRKQATKEEIQEMIDNFEMPEDNENSGKQLRAVTMKSNRDKTLNNPIRGDAAYVPMCDNAVFRKLLTFDLVDAPSPNKKDSNNNREMGKETRLYDDNDEDDNKEVVDVSMSKMKQELDGVRLKSAAADSKSRTVKFHIA